MNNLEQWQTNNENYLAAALDWLRLRLRRQAEVVAANRGDSADCSLFRFSKPSSSTAAIQEAVDRAATAMASEATIQSPPALIILSQLFGLSEFEQSVLLLCAAVELDTQIASLCASAQDDANRPYPTFALALSMFDNPTWDIVSAERPLRYWRLIEVISTGVQPLTTSPLRVDERLVNYLKGLNDLDPRLTSLLVPLQTAESQTELPPSQQAAVEKIVTHLQRTHANHSPVVQLVGPDSLSKQLAVQQAAAQLRLYPYLLPAEMLPAQIGELETLVRLWRRESKLVPIVLYLDAHQIDGKSPLEGQISPLHYFLTRSHALCFLSLREVQRQLNLTSLVIDVDKPTPAEQRSLWSDLIGPINPSSPARLSEQFNLNTVTIQQISQAAQFDAAIPHQSNPEAVHEQLWSACLTITRPQLDTLAQRLVPKATWADIVLPTEETNLLHQIADQVRQRSTVYDDWGFNRRMNRGLGISTLFVGESGTGKTMAAEVITNELQLNLYRIDLSSVVSKYIGETEKNLRRLFDAAEDGGAILFFDEADALFGKRSEVKDSHDRYANIEINYLLQRIESYRGLAILATNLKQAIDSAFLRRLRFIVTFPFPGAREREAIWRKAFPPETPIDDLDFKYLSRFSLTGGSIHNIVLNAAFLAAQADMPVAMPLVLSAARTEFRKLDRPINEADFRWRPIPTRART